MSVAGSQACGAFQIVNGDDIDVLASQAADRPYAVRSAHSKHVCPDLISHDIAAPALGAVPTDMVDAQPGLANVPILRIDR